MIRLALRKTLYFLFRLLTHLQVSGLENIPATGSCIVSANHLGILDGPLLFSLISRKDITALVAKKHQRNPIFRWIVNTAGGIWLDRFILEVKPLQQVYAHLKKGGLLGIAPEGTRSHSGQMAQGKSGVSFLASKIDVPIIPIAIFGTEDAVHRLLRLHRPTIHVRVGTPFHLAPVARQTREADLEHNTDEIMCHIAAMLPEKYHGFYANHPRIKELLEAGL